MPFQAGGAIVIIQGQNAIRKEILASAKNSARFAAGTLEREIQHLERQLEYLLMSPLMMDYVMRSGAMDLAELYTALNEQRDMMRQLYLGNELIEDIIIHYRGLEKSLSAARGYISANEGSYSDLVELLRNGAEAGPVRELGDKRFIASVYPGTAMYSYHDPVYIIQIALSESCIRRLMEAQSRHQTLLVFSNVVNVNASIENVEAFQALRQELLGGSAIAELETEETLIIAAGSGYLNCSVVHIIPKSQLFQVLSQFSLIMALFSLLCVAALCVYATISNSLIKKPVIRILEGFRQAESGNLGKTLPEGGRMAKEFTSLIEGFNHMSTSLAAAVDKLYQKELYAQRMELKQLQSQINPHFLYNTYFLLHRLVSQEEMETAQKLSAFLGEYFQYITRNWQDKAPLSAEWKHAASYLEIQSLRFADTLSIHIDPLPYSADNFLAPRLILQPILENAIEYGVKGAESGRVEMRYHEDESEIRICVSNWGNPVSKDELEGILEKLNDGEAAGETTALANIHRRLKLEFGSASGLLITEAASGGLSVCVAIKKTGDS
jgi:two-component system sensor histidine kinase YesM